MLGRMAIKSPHRLPVSSLPGPSHILPHERLTCANVICRALGRASQQYDLPKFPWCQRLRLRIRLKLHVHRSKRFAYLPPSRTSLVRCPEYLHRGLNCPHAVSGMWGSASPVGTPRGAPPLSNSLSRLTFLVFPHLLHFWRVSLGFII